MLHDPFDPAKEVAHKRVMAAVARKATALFVANTPEATRMARQLQENHGYAATRVIQCFAEDESIPVNLNGLPDERIVAEVDKVVEAHMATGLWCTHNT